MNCYVVNLKPLPYLPFYFLLPIYGRENIVLRSTFWNGDFDRFRMFWGPLNPKVTVLAVTSTVINITQKQLTAETSNLVFYICIIRRCYLKLFMKIRLKLCTGVQKRILIHYGLWTEFPEISGIPEYLNQQFKMKITVFMNRRFFEKPVIHENNYFYF